MENNDAASSAPPGAGDVKEKAQKTLQQQAEQRAKQAGEQVSGTAEDLRSVGEELRKQGKDGPAKIADRAAEQTEKVGSYLSGTRPDQMLHDVEDFGRERPWAMLAGGLAIGAVAARFLKASSRSRYQQRSSSNGAAQARGFSPSQTQPPTPPRESAEPIRPPAADGASSAARSVAEPAGSPVIGS